MLTDPKVELVMMGVSTVSIVYEWVKGPINGS
jgi:hypothetical protein